MLFLMFFGLLLAACSPATSGTQEGSEATESDVVAEERQSPKDGPQGWQNPNTAVVDALALSCGLTPAEVGKTRTRVETTRDGMPFSLLSASAFVGEGAKSAQADVDGLNCLLENSGSGKRLEDFVEGSELSVKGHVWFGSGGTWAVQGENNEFLPYIRLTFVGSNFSE